MPIPVAVGVGAIFPLVGVLALGRNRDHQGLFLLCFVALFVFGTLFYVGMLRHLGFAALLMIGLLWAQAEAGERLNGAARAWMALAALGGVWFAVTALVVPFSGGAALSDWARRTGSVNKPGAASLGPPRLLQQHRRTPDLQYSKGVLEHLPALELRHGEAGDGRRHRRLRRGERRRIRAQPRSARRGPRASA